MASNSSRALVRRDAGGRLVEQQHARARRQRERDLEQALLAVGELARERVRRRRRAAATASSARASSIAASRRRAAAASRAPRPLRSQIASITDSSDGQIREERVDLERARQAALARAACCAQRGDALAAEQDLARASARARR